jgi:hypothetical protein
MPRWSVSMIRKKAGQLGTVTASNERQAIEKAADAFNIPPARRNRIVVAKISDKDDDDGNAQATFRPADDARQHANARRCRKHY